MPSGCSPPGFQAAAPPHPPHPHPFTSPLFRCPSKACVTKEVTVFKCDLCKDNTRQVDTAHGGTLHHLLGNGHLKKVVASWWPELGAVDVDKAATELAVRLPGCFH